MSVKSKSATYKSPSFEVPSACKRIFAAELVSLDESDGERTLNISVYSLLVVEELKTF